MTTELANSDSSPDSRIPRIDIYAENERLRDELAAIDHSHRLEIQKIREEYDAEIENYRATISKLEDRIANYESQISSLANRSPADKDAIIQAQNLRIGQLTEKYEAEVDLRARQVSHLAHALERLERTIYENDGLRRHHNPEVTPSRVRVQIPVQREKTEEPIAEIRSKSPERVPDSPPVRKRRPPPNHRALVDQWVIVDREDPVSPNLADLSLDELRNRLEELEEQKAGLGHRINRVISPGRGQETFEKKREREADERRYDALSQMIGRIRFELRARNARATY